MVDLIQELQDSLCLSKKDSLLASTYFKRVVYPKGTYLQEIGSPCNKLYFLVQGNIRIFNLVKAKEITQWISIPGYFVTNLSAWLFDYPNTWNLQALNEIVVYEITKTDYASLPQVISNWYQKERFFIGHCFLQMESRINQFLSLNSEERYLAFCKEHLFLFNEVPHQYIASLLGMTSETLSRLRNTRAKQ